MKPKISLFKITTAVLVFSIAVFSILQSCQKEIETATPDQVTDQPDLNLKNSSDPILYFGHEVFTREKGKPVTVTMPIINPHFEHFDDLFVLNIQNGDGENNLVSSAIIKIDGEVIFGPSDFNQNVTFLSAEISLTAESVLEVKLNGKPGSYIDLWIDGELLPGKALISDAGGELYFEFIDYNINLSILPNTFSNNEIITVTEILPDEYDELFVLLNAEPLGNLINLESTNPNFNHLITLDLYYSQSLFNGEDNEDLLAFLHLVPEEESLFNYDNTIIDTDANHIQLKLPHFSIFTKLLFNFYWDVDILKYYIEPDESGLLWGTDEDQLENDYIVVESVNLWESHQCDFAFQRVFNSEDANIIIESVSWLFPDYHLQQPMGMAMMGVSRLGVQDDNDSPIVIKINYGVPGNSEDETLLRKVITHEFGHALGLHHIPVEQCDLPNNNGTAFPIMSVPNDYYDAIGRAITECDVDKLLCKYDPCTGGQPCPGTPTVTDADGNVYNTVKIGDQCWMAENLNYETGNSWCYDNDGNNCDIYGRLYDWETAMNACPTGWHLPSDAEWKKLEGTVDSQYGVGHSEWDRMMLRGFDAGKKLKSKNGYYSYGNGTDDFGFSAVPGGERFNSGAFFGVGKYSFYWSSTAFNSSSIASIWRSMGYSFDKVGRNWYYNEGGFSVRCVKD